MAEEKGENARAIAANRDPYDERRAAKRTGQHARKQFFPITAFWQSC